MTPSASGPPGQGNGPHGEWPGDDRPFDRGYGHQPYEYQGYPYASGRDDPRPYEVQPYDTRPYEVRPYEVQQYPVQQYPVQAYPVQPVGYGYPVPDPRQTAYQAQLDAARKSRMAAGLLGIFLGTLGIHNFYLGRGGIATLQLLLTVLSLGILAPLVWVWALIEGVLILTGSPSFRTDSKGIPLRD